MVLHATPALVGASSFLPQHELERRIGAPPGDLADLLTPFGFLGAAALVFRALRPGPRTLFLAAVAAILYVDGHGMHLAANSIGADPIVPRSAADRAYFYDERLGHIEWHLGWLGLMGAFVLAERPPLPVRPAAAVAAAGLLALILAAVSIEGQTWWLVLATAPAFAAAAVVRRGHVAVTCAAAVAAAAAGVGLWALIWSGVPQLTEVW